MSASKKAWLLYALLAIIGSLGSYFYIEHVRDDMWRNMLFQMEQDLGYPKLVVNKPYNSSTKNWSLWCAEFVLDGHKDSYLAYYEFTPNNSSSSINIAVDKSTQRLIEEMHKQLEQYGIYSDSKDKYYWMLGGETATERLNTIKQGQCPWLYLESLKTQDLIDILKVHNRYYYFPEYEYIFPDWNWSKIRTLAWFSSGLDYRGIDLRVVWCRQCTLSNQYYIDLLLLIITTLSVLALVVFLPFSKKIRQDKEAKRLKQDSEENPLWYELKELLSPARFIVDYDSEKVSLANSLYNELMNTQKNDREALASLHRKAIEQLNVPSVSEERLVRLKEICNPIRYMEPYDAEKVELANSLYSRLQNNSLSIEEIREIEEKANTL